MDDDEKEKREQADAADTRSVFGGPVGYGRPPRAHCFQPNQSGNLKGRPRGARGLKAEAAEVLNETFPLPGSRRRVSARKAMLLRQREKAIKHGDARSAAMLLDLARELEDDAEARARDGERRAIDDQDQALIAAALKRLGGDEEGA